MIAATNWIIMRYSLILLGSDRVIYPQYFMITLRLFKFFYDAKITISSLRNQIMDQVILIKLAT